MYICKIPKLLNDFVWIPVFHFMWVHFSEQACVGQKLILNIFLYYSRSYFFLQQNLILNLELIVSDWLATKHDLTTSSLYYWQRDERHAPLSPHFKWVLEIWSQFLTFSQQVANPLRCLPDSRCLNKLYS